MASMQLLEPLFFSVISYTDSVFEKTYATTQKTLKVMFWRILKKNVKKRRYSFTGNLITQLLITQLPEVSTGKSPTPNTRNYATEMARNGSHSGSWELNYNAPPDILRTKLLLTTFYDFLIDYVI